MTSPRHALQECTGSYHEKEVSSDLQSTENEPEPEYCMVYNRDSLGTLTTILQHFKPSDPLMLANVTFRYWWMYPAGKVDA